jgi:hypothetical protein
MDGISSAASVIAIIQLAGSLVTICGGYIQKVKHAREDSTGAVGARSHPLLRRAGVKGQEMIHPFTRKKQYFLADSSYTVTFNDSSGHMRDHFVILRSSRFGEPLPLIVYMGTSFRAEALYGLM